MSNGKVNRFSLSRKLWLLTMIPAPLILSCGPTTFRDGKSDLVTAKRSEDGLRGTIAANDALGGNAAAEADSGNSKRNENNDSKNSLSKLVAGAGSDIGSDAAGSSGTASTERKSSLIQAASLCAQKLNLGDSPTFEHLRVVGKNVNNQNIISDTGPRTVPAFVEIDVKNANHSMISLTAHNTSYCLSLSAKNANGIDIEIACDSRLIVLSASYHEGEQLSVIKSREVTCAK